MLVSICWQPISQRKSHGQPQCRQKTLHPRWSHSKCVNGERSEESGPIIPSCTNVHHGTQENDKGFLQPLAACSVAKVLQGAQPVLGNFWRLNSSQAPCGQRTRWPPCSIQVSWWERAAREARWGGRSQQRCREQSSQPKNSSTAPMLWGIDAKESRGQSLWASQVKASASRNLDRKEYQVGKVETLTQALQLFRFRCLN